MKTIKQKLTEEQQKYNELIKRMSESLFKQTNKNEMKKNIKDNSK